MKSITPMILSVLALSSVGCTNSSHNRNPGSDYPNYALSYSTTAADAENMLEADSIIRADTENSIATDTPTETDTENILETDCMAAEEAENLFETDPMLLSFKVVIDTLNSAGNHLVHSTYFFHDITGDGLPELWIISGTCEADRELWVYRKVNRSVKKILSDYGGHTDFYLKGDTIGSLTCNTGTGCVNRYSYKDHKIEIESVKYNEWDGDEPIKINSEIDRQIADIWLKNDSMIELKGLK